MRIVAQRVGEASVAVDGAEIARIGRGLLLLAGVAQDDTPEDGAWLAGKLARLRIFPDAEGKMNFSLLDIAGDALVVSQFTLFASTAKGNRPGFAAAAGPELAVPIYEGFAAALSRELGRPVATGRFGADMEVALRNQGPVTILMDSKRRE
ncbi:MAG: D-tyrosyl-tRNA(Tyr) deacylase [Fibrobacteres bacterium]|jgi:D-tyrosyl-tRNA(Tyr) deacylase|nr:D-tyrosyl-tRNA(Tyr) deacylase [Fibrobacterota bacterium]